MAVWFIHITPKYSCIFLLIVLYPRYCGASSHVYFEASAIYFSSSQLLLQRGVTTLTVCCASTLIMLG